MDRSTEFDYMVDFAMTHNLDEGLVRDRLRVLWTAHCLHYDLVVDTVEYDVDLTRLWGVVAEEGGGTSEWSDRDSFNKFMCQYLA